MIVVATNCLLLSGAASLFPGTLPENIHEVKNFLKLLILQNQLKQFDNVKIKHKQKQTKKDAIATKFYQFQVLPKTKKGQYLGYYFSNYKK